MNASEFLKSPLIKVLCVNVGINGRRCFSWLGDMVSGLHTIQNFRCQKCSQEWLVDKDKSDTMVFTKVSRLTKKNYLKDTGFKIELHQEHMDKSSPIYANSGEIND